MRSSSSFSSFQTHNAKVENIPRKFVFVAFFVGCFDVEDNERAWKVRIVLSYSKTSHILLTFWIVVSPHYSKSQIFVQKFNFDKTPTFSRVFHPKFFWQFFSWNQSCQQLKSPKPQHFHEFFTHKNRDFGQKMKISNSVTYNLKDASLERRKI